MDGTEALQYHFLVLWEWDSGFSADFWNSVLSGVVFAQVYSPNMPPTPAQPSSILLYPLVSSQPSAQYILQGSLPLAGCGAVQSLVPVPTVLATASELAGQATTTTSSEERTATPRPAAEKTKKEEVSAAYSMGSHLILKPKFLG
jgi:hypothetical protein